LRKVKSPTLKECAEEKTRGALHPKCRSERRKQEEHFIPNAEAREESKRNTSSQMQKREKKVRGALHPKCRSEKRKQEEHFIPNAEAREESKRSTSSQMQKREKLPPFFAIFFFSMVFFFFVIFSFLLFEKKKMPGEIV
jgi:Fe2+ transport system protein B